jgi:hypothetical protein
MQRAQLIRKLVLDSQYVIDEHLVAAAILARAATRRAVGEMAFRNDARDARRPRTVRSFRPSSDVPSFRPCTLRGFHARQRGPHAGLI